LAALAHSDEAGDISPLVRLFLKVLSRGVDLMERPEFAWELFQTDLKVREQSTYVRWQKTVSRFFEEVAARLLLSRNQLSVIGRISASDYALLSRGDHTGNAWFAKASSPGKVTDILIWVGYTSAKTQRALELDQVFPSFFLSERDPNLRAIKPYRQNVADQEPLHDELCIIADEDRVLFRRGDRVSRVRMTDAAELFSALLSTYLNDLPI
jgi:hypothetical protein